MEGIAVLDKPSGMTSHDVVSRVRRIFKMKRVGHAGTLDPLATGVLIVLVGKSTKLFDKFVAFDKAYIATLQLGRKTTTADIEGETLEEKEWSYVGADDIERACAQFRGDIAQIPPMYSAVKIKGKKLYQLARKGIEVERQPRQIRIDALKVLDIQGAFVRFYVECSKGTYIRKLAEDIGDALGCGACISQIQRTKVGPFSIEESVALEDLHEDHIRNWQL
jgi:tRNA pseudouridine55 synthase